MNIVVLALGSIGLSVAAQFALKAGMGQPEMQAMMSQPLSVRAAIATATNLLVVTGFALYGLGAVVWLGVLARWDVSKAYPLVGLGFAATVGIGMLLGEQVTVWRVLGVALICAGVILVGRS